MKFNFETYALCVVEPEEDSRSYPEGFSARVLGFWKSRFDVEAGASLIEDKRRADDAAWVARQRSRGAWAGDGDYQPQRYIFVPLREMEFKSLDYAERVIEQAACLMAKGVGVATQ